MTTRAVGTDRLGVSRVGLKQKGPARSDLRQGPRSHVLAAGRRAPRSQLPLLAGAERAGQSDALEARTKLTSHSALEPGGLPGPAVPRCTSGGTETRAGLNSRLEAVSGA